MIVLGVDPGIRHTGYAVLRGEGKACRILESGTIIPGPGRLTVGDTVEVVIPFLGTILKTFKPSAVAVEEVSFYGRRRRAMFPLAHIAGAILGMCLASRISTYLLLAHMKKASARKKWPGAAPDIDQHQLDAAALAKTILDYELALGADDASYLTKHSATGRRKSTVGPGAPTRG